MKHKKQKKTKKAGRILLAVFAVLIGTLGVLLFTSERWMRKTWPNLSMEELVYQLKAPIAGTSHDLLMSYVCSSALIAAAALILLILVSIFLREKRKAHVAFGMICIEAEAASHRLFHQGRVGSTGRKRLSEKSEHVQYRGRRQLRRSGPREYHVPGTETKSDLSLSGIHGEHLRRQSLRRSIR